MLGPEPIPCLNLRSSKIFAQLRESKTLAVESPRPKSLAAKPARSQRRTQNLSMRETMTYTPVIQTMGLSKADDPGLTVLLRNLGSDPGMCHCMSEWLLFRMRKNTTPCFGTTAV